MRWPWVSAARLDDALAVRVIQALRIQTLEAQLDALRQDQLRLVEKVLRPHDAPVPQRQAAVLDEETRTLAQIRDDTIERMAEAFVTENGMSKADALAEARRLATTAEALYG